MSKYSLVFLAVLLPATAYSQAKPIAVEDFMKFPQFSSARISPDGKYLALTVDRGDQDILTVLKTSDLSIVKINQLPEKESIGQFSWISDDRLMFNSVIKQGGFAQPRSTGKWFAVNADGSMPRPVIFYGTRDATQQSKTVGAQSFSLLDPLIDDGANVLMTAYFAKGDGAGAEAVLVDTISGRRKVLANAPGLNCGFTLNKLKQVNYALCGTSKGDNGEFDSFSELHRLGADGKWTLLSSTKKDGLDLSVLGESDSGRVYATRSDRKKPAEFGELNPQTGEFTSLYRNDVTEVSSYIGAAKGDDIIGLITEAGAPEVTILEKSHPDAKLYAGLSQSFEGQMVRFSSATRDGDTILFSVSSDRNPGELYLYDRKANKARFLMSSRNLDAKAMAEVIPINFKSRDGLTIHGYLTMPKQGSGRDMPLIVNPHGGPMGPRDNWGFNPEAQLFANRGYAVLQINFRGSGGYGKAFEDMAYGQWADGITNDIIDATRWAIEEGYADKDRICIYGGSFGGYAAMMVPIKAQGLYKCAFGYVGAYSADVQMSKSDTSRRDDGIKYLKRALGDTAEKREAVMPLAYADKVKIPVFLAAGARDQRCPPENTTLMAKALEAAGNKPEGVIIQSGEGHGFYDVANRVSLYTQMLAFFDKHIGGG